MLELITPQAHIVHRNTCRLAAVAGVLETRVRMETGTKPVEVPAPPISMEDAFTGRCPWVGIEVLIGKKNHRRVAYRGVKDDTDFTTDVGVSAREYAGRRGRVTGGSIQANMCMGLRLKIKVFLGTRMVTVFAGIDEVVEAR